MGPLKGMPDRVKRSRRAEHGGNVRIDLRIQRHDRRNDLHLVDEAFRKQRPDRTVDQSGGQGFLFAGAAFPLEEAAGNPSGGVGLFLVIDGEREKIAFPGDFPDPDCGHEHHGAIHVHHHGGIGLAGDFARFESYNMVTVAEIVSESEGSRFFPYQRARVRMFEFTLICASQGVRSGSGNVRNPCSSDSRAACGAD